MELNYIHPAGARMLADAIIEGAVKDLGKAYMRYLQNTNPIGAANDYRAVRAAEIFFSSQLYEMLTSLDGKYLIRKTKEECKDIAKHYLTHTEAKRKYHLSASKLAFATSNGIVRVKMFCSTGYVHKGDIERWLANDT